MAKAVWLLRLLGGDGRLVEPGPRPGASAQGMVVADDGEMVPAPLSAHGVVRPGVDFWNASTGALASGTLYAVYFGRTCRPITAQFLSLRLIGAGAGAQTAEFGVGSSASGAVTGSLDITVLAATGTVGSLTAGSGYVTNTAGFAYDVAAGTHLWGLVRTAMATTQPAFYCTATCGGRGRLRFKSASGVIAAGGVVTATSVVGALSVCPYMELVL